MARYADNAWRRAEIHDRGVWDELDVHGRRKHQWSWADCRRKSRDEICGGAFVLYGSTSSLCEIRRRKAVRQACHQPWRIGRQARILLGYDLWRNAQSRCLRRRHSGFYWYRSRIVEYGSRRTRKGIWDVSRCKTCRLCRTVRFSRTHWFNQADLRKARRTFDWGCRRSDGSYAERQTVWLFRRLFGNQLQRKQNYYGFRRWLLTYQWHWGGK